MTELKIGLNLSDEISKISEIVKKEIDVKLDICIDPYFNTKLKNESDKQKFINIIYKSYIQEYLNILKEYGPFYIEGTGIKTNKYGEPCQNFAYNYINHSEFEKMAKEWSNYDRYDRGVGKIQYYKYFESVWSIACNRVMEKYKDQYGECKFNLKLDHRYKDRKNNDFDGTLIVINPNDNSFWKARNLPKNQRYS